MENYGDTLNRNKMDLQIITWIQSAFIQEPFSSDLSTGMENRLHGLQCVYFMLEVGIRGQKSVANLNQALFERLTSRDRLLASSHETDPFVASIGKTFAARGSILVVSVDRDHRRTPTPRRG